MPQRGGHETNHPTPEKLVLRNQMDKALKEEIYNLVKTVWEKEEITQE